MKKSPELLDLFTAETEQEFEVAFDKWLERAIIGLETNKLNFQEMKEVGLTGALALALNMPGIDVHQEPNSNGHVDLLIEVWLGVRTWRKLGEAKVYDGPDYHIEGLKQLLGRYTTGRETRGVLIEYVTKANIAALMKKVRDRMDELLPESQTGACADHSLKWSFLSKHNHSCGENLEVGHIGCNLFVSDSKVAQ
jgi:hypothetical protein